MDRRRFVRTTFLSTAGLILVQPKVSLAQDLTSVRSIATANIQCDGAVKYESATELRFESTRGFLPHIHEVIITEDLILNPDKYILENEDFIRLPMTEPLVMPNAGFGERNLYGLLMKADSESPFIHTHDDLLLTKEQLSQLIDGQCLSMSFGKNRVLPQGHIVNIQLPSEFIKS